MRVIRNRIIWYFVMIILIVSVIVVKLIQLQYLDAERYAEQAKKQRLVSRVIPAKRGRILDSAGEVLAISSESYRILAKLDKLDASESKKDLNLIGEVVEFDVEKVVADMIQAGVGNYVVVKDRISKSDIDLVNMVIANKGIQNIVTDKVNDRTYPFRSLGSFVVGLTNLEGNGYLGVELYYNDLLSGENGLETRTIDAERNPLPYGIHEIEKPKDGQDVYLTTKNSIQFFVDRAVKEFYTLTEAKSVSVVVSNVNDNSILAMSTYPNFDLSHPYEFGDDMDERKWETLTEQEKTDYYYGNRWRNLVVSNTYEPGSVMKSLITAIALEEKLVTPETEFSCQGIRKVADQELKCISYPYGYGMQTVERAFINSCNVTYMQISERIGRERLYKYLRKLHMVDATGIDLPNESSPIYVEEKDVGPVELATLGYGHAININMMNMVVAVSALVNGGYYIPPYIATTADKVPLKADALRKERVFSKETSDTMRRLMEAQTANTLIYNEAVRIGGKSGTTVKIVDGAYDDDTIISSYIAFAPMENPTYCVYAVIDEPNVEIHGLMAAHKLVKRVFSDIFRLYAIDTEVRDGVRAQVPNLVGETLRLAEEIAGWNGFEVSTHPPVIDEEEKDAYVVTGQYPAAGVFAGKGSVMILSVEKKGKEKE